MSMAHALSPSSQSLSGMYLHHLANNPNLHPSKDAPLGKRVKAFGKRSAGAVPLFVTAALDLTILATMTLSVERPMKIGAKNHAYNCASSLGLLFQALPMLILGRVPKVNMIRNFSSSTNLHKMLSHSLSTIDKELILSQLKKLDQKALKVIREADGYIGDSLKSSRTYLLLALRTPWPELVDFLIANKFTSNLTSRNAEWLMRELLVVASSKKLTSEERQVYESTAENFLKFAATYDLRDGAKELLNLAVVCGFKKVVQALLAKDDASKTILRDEQRLERNAQLFQIAADKGQIEIMQLMLELDPNLLKDAIYNAWDLALKKNYHSAILNFLIEQGVHPNTSSCYGPTGMQFGFFGLAISDDPPHPKYNTLKYYFPDYSLEELAARFETIKMLVKAGACFNEVDFKNDLFIKALAALKAGDGDKLKEIKSAHEASGESKSLFVSQFLWMAARAPWSGTQLNLVKNLEYMLAKIPELKQISNEKIGMLNQSINPKGSEGNFPLDLVEIISGY